LPLLQHVQRLNSACNPSCQRVHPQGNRSSTDPGAIALVWSRPVTLSGMDGPHTADHLVLRRAAIADGRSDEELARLIRRRSWARVRRGAYLDGQLPTSAVARHALLVAATLADLRRPAVVSHQSAAVLLGLPLWGANPDKVHITRCRRRPARPPVLSVATSPACEMRRSRQWAVSWSPTSHRPLDLARSLPFESAVVAVDAALHEGLLPRELLEGRMFDIARTRSVTSAGRSCAGRGRISPILGASETGSVEHTTEGRATTPEPALRVLCGHCGRCIASDAGTPPAMRVQGRLQ
jgi:hypothetical protein